MNDITWSKATSLGFISRKISTKYCKVKTIPTINNVSRRISRINTFYRAFCIPSIIFFNSQQLYKFPESSYYFFHERDKPRTPRGAVYDFTTHICIRTLCTVYVYTLLYTERSSLSLSVYRLYIKLPRL
jgi:hypothetical protein